MKPGKTSKKKTGKERGEYDKANVKKRTAKPEKTSKKTKKVKEILEEDTSGGKKEVKPETSKKAKCCKECPEYDVCEEKTGCCDMCDFYNVKKKTCANIKKKKKADKEILTRKKVEGGDVLDEEDIEDTLGAGEEDSIADVEDDLNEDIDPFEEGTDDFFNT